MNKRIYLSPDKLQFFPSIRWSVINTLFWESPFEWDTETLDSIEKSVIDMDPQTPDQAVQWTREEIKLLSCEKQRQNTLTLLQPDQQQNFCETHHVQNVASTIPKTTVTILEKTN